MEQKRQQLVDLLQSANVLTQELREELMSDAAYRKKITHASKTVLRQVQAPPERAWEIFTYPAVVAALRMASDTGWLDQVAQASDTRVTAEELARENKADPSLTARIMRLLGAVGIVEELGVKTYASNEMTTMLSASDMRHGINVFSNNLLTMFRMPSYFENANYQTPPDVAGTPFAFAEGLSFWKKLATEPARQAAFDKFMDGHRVLRLNWHDNYPLEKFRVGGDDEILLVDVAGGLGHDLVKFDERRKTLDLLGRLILQDRPVVLAEVPQEWRKQFDSIAHDIFEPQPDLCRDARVYHMRMIIHDWADGPCLTILRRLRDAMKAGYSTLLICDMVFPDTGCPFWEAAFDITVMAMMSGKERTLQEWHDLIGHVDGLKIESIRSLDEGATFESLIEITKTGE